jgi:hypothetical protein
MKSKAHHVTLFDHHDDRVCIYAQNATEIPWRQRMQKGMNLRTLTFLKLGERWGMDVEIVSGDKPDMETLDSAHMRVLNSSTLLKMIWRDHAISRADISQRTGMSRSTVSTIVADLIRRGLVTETGTGHSNGGRRPVILSFNEDAYSILGIDVQPQRLRVAVTNLRAGIRHWWQEECPVQEEPETTLARIFAWIQKAKSLCIDEGKPLIGIGFGLPGPVHPNAEVNAMCEDLFPRWRGLHLQNAIREKIQLPVAFEKEANLGALAEHWWKNPKGPGNLAYITPHWQVGLVFDGRVHRGSHGMAGNAAPLHPSLNGREDKGLVQLITNLLALLDLDSVVLDQDLLERNIERLRAVRDAVGEGLRGLGQRRIRLDFGSMGESQVALGASTQILHLALEDFTLFPTSPATSQTMAWTEEAPVAP